MGGVKYTVSPVGKQYRDIGQLSGGEKTVATLALLFALHSFQRAPFFIMDEVDDALDNANVERVTRYLLENSKTTQCIIISHKDLLFEKSDSLVGVYHSWQESSSATLTLDLRKYDTPSESQSCVCCEILFLRDLCRKLLSQCISLVSITYSFIMQSISEAPIAGLRLVWQRSHPKQSLA